MAVNGFRELLPREFSRSYGSGASAQRTFVVSCDATVRAEPTLSAVASGGSGASLSVAVVFNGGTPRTWSVAAIAVDAGGTGYTVNAPVTINLGSEDTLSASAVAKVGSVGIAGNIVAVTVTSPGAYWKNSGQEATSTQEILNAIGIFEGSPHPEYPGLYSSGVSLSRNGDDGVQVEYSYDTEDKADTNPLTKAPEWSFSTGSVTIPSLSYFLGDGNANVQPLTNAVGEYVWEGLTHNITEVKATIVQNKLIINQVEEFGKAGCVNAGNYLWGSQYTWQCTNVSATRQQDKVGDEIQRYWKMTYELTYRAAGWYYNLPHVGWGYADGNQYKRCQILNGAGDLVDAPKPMPLNANGGLKFPVGQNGIPDQILRRVHPEISFSVFGTPPL